MTSPGSTQSVFVVHPTYDYGTFAIFSEKCLANAALRDLEATGENAYVKEFKLDDRAGLDEWIGFRKEMQCD